MDGGEGSSQGPQPYGGSGGSQPYGGSQGPQPPEGPQGPQPPVVPQGSQPSDSNPDQNDSNPNQNSVKEDTDTDTDTDKLASYLEVCKTEGNLNYLRQTPIRFTNEPLNKKTIYHKYTSIIAKYVKENHPEIFPKESCHVTPIDRELIRKLRQLNKNVPSSFVKKCTNNTSKIMKNK
jgi:hypothetical protein